MAGLKAKLQTAREAARSYKNTVDSYVTDQRAKLAVSHDDSVDDERSKEQVEDEKDKEKTSAAEDEASAADKKAMEKYKKATGIE